VHENLMLFRRKKNQLSLDEGKLPPLLFHLCIIISRDTRRHKWVENWSAKESCPELSPGCRTRRGDGRTIPLHEGWCVWRRGRRRTQLFVGVVARGGPSGMRYTMCNIFPVVQPQVASELFINELCFNRIFFFGIFFFGFFVFVFSVVALPSHHTKPQVAATSDVDARKVDSQVDRRALRGNLVLHHFTLIIAPIF